MTDEHPYDDTLTAQGVRVGRTLTMAGEDGAMVPDALLDATES